VYGVYRAAGIFAYCVNEGNVYVLMVKEDRSFKRKSEGLVWCLPGGKIENNEKSPWETAFREFQEETANIFLNINQNT